MIFGESEVISESLRIVSEFQGGQRSNEKFTMDTAIQQLSKTVWDALTVSETNSTSMILSEAL